MSIQIEYERAVANRGNWYRIKKVMERAAAGEKITLGFLGGFYYAGKFIFYTGDLLCISCV